ncbi:hypothetical protein AVEN_56768-1 [Araneus ventricosus]|uniref:Uncharacterized protein n=1 Tax=Araneus ventricosus TaxID=182803 RepID=A0A4Y2EYQ0_ARAVE|nr:hypothetical protein AVEN_56768-1 [Araneus ventricosus]
MERPILIKFFAQKIDPVAQLLVFCWLSCRLKVTMNSNNSMGKNISHRTVCLMVHKCFRNPTCFDVPYSKYVLTPSWDCKETLLLEGLWGG